MTPAELAIILTALPAETASAPQALPREQRNAIIEAAHLRNRAKIEARRALVLIDSQSRGYSREVARQFAGWIGSWVTADVAVQAAHHDQTGSPVAHDLGRYVEAVKADVEAASAQAQQVAA
jgi:hypothetical protein